MAKVQSAGTSWMVASAVLGIAFFITLILAILFYTRVSTAEQQAQTDRNSLNQWVSSAERSAPDMLPLVEEARSQGVSVVSRLRENLGWVKELAAKDANATQDEIKQRLASAGVPEGQNLLDTIVQLRTVHQNDLRTIEQLKADLQKEQQNAQQAVKAQQTVTASFNKSSAALKAELDKLNREFQAYKTRSDNQAKSFVGSVDADRRQALNTIAQQKATIEQLEAQGKMLQYRFDVLSAQRNRVTGTVDPSLLADGRITSILSDSRVVYIDRGRKDRIVLGLTFEVFDANAGVAKDDRGEVRGKATIEVVNVLDNAAVARVVRRDPGMELVVGDIVANAVYDPNMTFNFHIFGDFDLDGIGQTSLTDRRRVEGMITGWGGRVVEGEQGKLNPDTDFLVLGQEPELPAEPKDKTDPVTIENYNKAKAKYETYQTLLAEAKRQSIPILNQNRFLAMVGYYQR